MEVFTPPTAASRWSFVRCRLSFHSGDGVVDASGFAVAVTAAVRGLLGEVGAALPVEIILFDDALQEAILRCPAPRLSQLWGSLTTCTEFDKRPCSFRVVAVAGSLLSLAGSSREWCRDLALRADPG